jgi:hypothetical protein
MRQILVSNGFPATASTQTPNRIRRFGGPTLAGDRAIDNTQSRYARTGARDSGSRQQRHESHAGLASFRKSSEFRVKMNRRLRSCGEVAFCLVCIGRIQGQPQPPDACKGVVTSGGSSVVATSDPQPRHILGIFPNHNASPCLSPYVPVGTKDKFKIASEDAFDPGAVALAALTGGAAELFNSNRPFGQEASGYFRYFGAAYANHVIGDFLTEGAYPSLFHQDPRYFRKGSGSPAGARVRYAINRVFLTQTDAGGTAFNYSRVLGAATTVAISSSYYVHHRDAAASAVGLGAQLGGAMAANILKEFWPDVLRKVSKKH